ncbi:MAG: glycosyl hydrolase family 65 protein [Armatimonadota bacterium]
MHRSVVRGIALIIFAAAIIIGMLFLPKHASKNHPPNDDPWLLVSYDPDNPYGTYLGNGFISCRIMGEGVGNHNGQPLPCYMAGLYDDEKLIPTPTWSDLRFYDGKTEFKIDKKADYKQVLNMKTGILATYATWRAGRKTLKGKIEVIVSRAEPRFGVVIWTITPNFTGTLTSHTSISNVSSQLEMVPDKRCCQFPRTLSYTWMTKQGKTAMSLIKITTDSARVTRATKIAPFGISTQARVELGEPYMLMTSASFGRGHTPAMAKASANEVNVYLDAMKSFSAHKRAWANLWKHDIIIDGPKRDQQAIHACMFYLLQSVREGSQWSIPPMGLSNNVFSGHVFWDADLWMFPALILQHPELAKSIIDYRYNTLPGAMANAKEHGFAGAEYAWESGYTGKEDTPEGLAYRYERHINGDIALCQWQYFLATGDLNWLKTRGYPVLKATADYWISRVKWVSEKGRYEILQVVPPDENAELINNSAYTNIIAQMNLQLAQKAAKQIGVAPSPKWDEVAEKMYIPYDATNKRFIAFEGHKPNWKAKQADSELIIYPLQYNIPGQNMTDIYRSTFDYYSKRVLPNGPAMITSAYSVIAARFGDCDRAYTEFVKSYKPYFRGPFNYFNEKASTTIDNQCFLTGAAGPIQSTLFGLAGAHMDYFAQDNGKNLNWSPCLPKQWKSLKLTGVNWRGKAFDVVISPGNKVSIQANNP